MLIKATDTTTVEQLAREMNIRLLLIVGMLTGYIFKRQNIIAVLRLPCRMRDSASKGKLTPTFAETAKT